VPTNCVWPASSGWASGFSGSLFSPCIGRLDLGSGPTQRADHVQSYRTILCGFAFRAGKVEVNLPLLRIVTGTGGRRERDEFTGCLARGGDDASEVGRRRNENAIRNGPRRRKSARKRPSPRRHESPRPADGRGLESYKWLVNCFHITDCEGRGPPVSPRRRSVPRQPAPRRKRGTKLSASDNLHPRSILIARMHARICDHLASTEHGVQACDAHQHGRPDPPSPTSAHGSRLSRPSASPLDAVP
jgi:hypothetical protein